MTRRRSAEVGPNHQIHEANRESLRSVTVDPATPIAAAITQLDDAGTGALALCNRAGRLVGVLTDGDLRRAVLSRISLDQPVEVIATQDPIVAEGVVSSATALQLMVQHDINHLPILDSEGTLIDFVLRRDIVSEAKPDVSAVIMAGGYGTRLRPLTDDTPKPMLPVGDRPILERTIDQLRRSGINQVRLTTHYLPDSIVAHFGDGSDFGVSISYANEDEPRGTVGGLRALRCVKGTLLVINGDIITGVSYQEMAGFHRRQRATITVGVRVHEIQIPFGVVDCDGERVTNLREKPSVRWFVNAGVYLIEPSALDYIPDGHFDMTDLIDLLLEEGYKVAAFPIIEYWQDLGRHEDYIQAQADWHAGRI